MTDETKGSAQENLNGNLVNVSNQLTQEQISALMTTLSQTINGVVNVVNSSLSNTLGRGLGGLNMGNLLGSGSGNLTNLLNSLNLKNLTSSNSSPIQLDQLENILPKFETVNESGKFQLKMNGETMFDLDLSQFSQSNHS